MDQQRKRGVYQAQSCGIVSESGLTIIHMVRHGQTDWNAEGRLQGQADIPLSRRGRQEAQIIADWLCGKGISSVYTSDLGRALGTARIIGATVRAPVVLESRFREINAGIWTGQKKATLATENSRAWQEWREGLRAVAEGESYADLQARAVAALKDVCKRESDKRTVIVTHQGIIRVILACIAHRPLSTIHEPHTGSRTTLEIAGDEIRVLSTDHVLHWE